MSASSEEPDRPAAAPEPGEQGRGAFDGAWSPLTYGALLTLVLVVFGAIRWRLLDTPLERDEGEYAVFAQLLLDGVPPYEQAVNMKLPGIYLVYAGILAVFGETARGIHMGLLLANLAAAVLAGSLARRTFRSGGAGLAAAAAFLAFTLGPRVQGPWANAEAFLLPFVLLAGVLFVRTLEKERRLPGLAATGLALGCSVLVKQHGVFFCLAAGGTLVGWHLARSPRQLGALVREALVLIGATLVPYLLTVAWLAFAGVFDRFWFWTWTYARTYTGQYDAGDIPERLRLMAPGTLQAVWPLVVVAGLGIVGGLALARTRRAGLALSFLALLSFAAVSVGFHYRPHYFQLLAPVVALGCGGFVALASARPAVLGLGAVAALAVAYVPFEERSRLFELTPQELAAQTYSINCFDAMPEVGEYLAELVPEGERFVVIGSEPQLYFYADRRPATSYVYTYALMEEQPYALQMHGEMAGEIEEAEPDVAVFVYVPTTWLRQESSERYIFDWAEKYLYGWDKTGVLLNTNGRRQFFTGEQARNVRVPPPQQGLNPVILEIYRRARP